MYYLLTESLKEQETQLVQIILDAVPAQNMYLLGSTLVQRRTETVFMPDAPSCRNVGHYYILVLVGEACNCGLLQDKLENICRQFIPVTALVLSTDRFMEWLLAGHPFAKTVQKRAVLLHGEPIHCNTLQTTAALPAGEAEKLNRQSLQKVKAFFAGAELYIVRMEYKMAAFMLHQCAEHALLAIFKAGSGLQVNTHSLDKLIRYCGMVNYKITEIFPRQNEQQARLFQLLQKAYIDTRYKDNYSISTVELQTLKEILLKLVEMLPIIQQTGKF
jgi:HEPN domain-containing protein